MKLDVIWYYCIYCEYMFLLSNSLFNNPFALADTYILLNKVHDVVFIFNTLLETILRNIKKQRKVFSMCFFCIFTNVGTERVSNIHIKYCSQVTKTNIITKYIFKYCHFTNNLEFWMPTIASNASNMSVVQTLKHQKQWVDSFSILLILFQVASTCCDDDESSSVVVTLTSN